MITRLRRALRERPDEGFTLVELLVAMVIMVALAGIIVTSFVAAQKSQSATQQQTDANEQARRAMNRLARDLRQAIPLTYMQTTTPAIASVTNPDGAAHNPNAMTSVTFDADFNGDGCVAGVNSDGCVPGPAVDPNNPERITYCYDPAAQQLYLVPGTLASGTTTCQPATGTAQPLLSVQVAGFELFYRSKLYLYDANGDGLTTWSELDAADPPIGDRNGVLDSTELVNISSVVIQLTMKEGSHQQVYQTQVDLRNVS